MTQGRGEIESGHFESFSRSMELPEADTVDYRVFIDDDELFRWCGDVGVVNDNNTNAPAAHSHSQQQQHTHRALESWRERLMDSLREYVFIVCVSVLFC